MAARMLIAHSSLLHLETHRRPRHPASPSFRPLIVNASMSTSLYPIGISSGKGIGELGYWKGIQAVVSGSDAPVSFSDPVEGLDLKSAVEVEFGGGDDGGSNGGKGFGGGGGGGGNEGEGNEEEDDAKAEKKTGMSMSQKLTLGYAALVGLGGLMGYLKSGSLKSLAAGVLSASVLFFVYTQLPARPALASAVGLGLSAALLVVMGSRFKKSGKVFPAGVVSLVSFIMTGGYFHGIMRGH